MINKDAFVTYYRSKTNGHIAPHHVWFRDIRKGYMTIANLEPVFWIEEGVPDVSITSGWVNLDKEIEQRKIDLVYLEILRTNFDAKYIEHFPKVSRWKMLKEWLGVKL